MNIEQTENKQRKGDFISKYLNGDDIYNDETLTASEQTRELVKHYAMCLFGLATDMANAEQRVIAARLRYVQLKNENKELRGIIKQLREKSNKQPQEPKQQGQRLQRINDLTSEERQAIQADYYEKRIVCLSEQVKYWRQKYNKAIGKNEGGNNGE